MWRSKGRRRTVRCWDLYVRFIRVEIGAGDGIRTRDINLGKVALYQLSYSREANCTAPPGERHYCRALAGELSNSVTELSKCMHDDPVGLRTLIHP